MKWLLAIPLALTMTAEPSAAEQEQQEIGPPPDPSNLIMQVTEEGEVELFEAQSAVPDAAGHLVFDKQLTEAIGDEPIYRLITDESAAPGSVMTFPGDEWSDPEVIYHSTGYRIVPGSQGSIAPGQKLTAEEQRTIIDTLAEYASSQAIAAANAFCNSQNAMRPESVIITAGGTPLQVSVTWSVDQACQVGQAEE